MMQPGLAYFRPHPRRTNEQGPREGHSSDRGRGRETDRHTQSHTHAHTHTLSLTHIHMIPGIYSSTHTITEICLQTHNPTCMKVHTDSKTEIPKDKYVCTHIQPQIHTHPHSLIEIQCIQKVFRPIHVFSQFVML